MSIESSEDGVRWLPLEERGVPVVDDGYDLSVAFTGETAGTGLGVYETRWYGPAERPARWHRFRIEPRQGQEVLFSKAFR